jgi:hypothetical protein
MRNPDQTMHEPTWDAALNKNERYVLDLLRDPGVRELMVRMDGTEIERIEIGSILQPLPVSLDQLVKENPFQEIKIVVDQGIVSYVRQTKKQKLV